MSPEAIDMRIGELSQLWKLAMTLQTARRLGPVAEIDAGRLEDAASPPAQVLEKKGRRAQALRARSPRVRLDP